MPKLFCGGGALESRRIRFSQRKRGHSAVTWIELGRRIILLAACAVVFTGCQERRGPAPVISAEAVERASANTGRIIQALSVDAGVSPPIPSPDWYFVAEAGFNFVDDQCRSYFDELFFLDRAREQTKTGLASAGQTAAAIMGVTGASSTSLAVVAQAFGFGINATDFVAGSYLYRLPPAATLGFVQRLQSAFRDAASRQHTYVNTPSAVYYLVQRYLDLCLPPRIEAEITKQISGARAVSVPRGRGAFFTLETVTPARVGVGVPNDQPRSPPIPYIPSRPSVGPARTAPRSTEREVIISASPAYATLFLNFDPRLHTADRVAAVFRKLCIPEAELRASTQLSHTLVKVYQQSVGKPITGTITVPEFTRLDDTRLRDCTSPNALNFVEMNRLGGDVATRTTASLLNRVLSDGEKLNESGELDLSSVREKIRVVRSRLADKLVLRDSVLSNQITIDMINGILER